MPTIQVTGRQTSKKIPVKIRKPLLCASCRQPIPRVLHGYQRKTCRTEVCLVNIHKDGMAMSNGFKALHRDRKQYLRNRGVDVIVADGDRDFYL